MENKDLPQRFTRIYSPLQEETWVYPEWYKKLIENKLFRLGYHRCKCGILLNLHRQVCDYYYCLNLISN